MTKRGPQPGQSPEQRAQELKRRHVEARRRQTRRRRTWVAVGATAIVLAVVAGVLTARALGPWGSGRGPAASAATRPAASSSAASASAGEAASPATQSEPKPTFVVGRALGDVGDAAWRLHATAMASIATPAVKVILDRAAEIVIDRLERGNHFLGEGECDGARRPGKLARAAPEWAPCVRMAVHDDFCILITESIAFQVSIQGVFAGMAVPEYSSTRSRVMRTPSFT